VKNLNFPYGNPVKTGIDAASVDFLALLRELQAKMFNGYLCITVKGVGGLEEGVMVFDNGKIVASVYEYFKYNKTILGDQAFFRVLNASAAKHGVIDLYQLSNEQVQLILAFNEQAISIPTEKDFKSVKLDRFNPAFEEQVREQAKAETEAELLKKYKLGEVREEKKESSEEIPLGELESLVEKR
jgi:hypothetical protein